MIRDGEVAPPENFSYFFYSARVFCELLRCSFPPLWQGGNGCRDLCVTLLSCTFSLSWLAVALCPTQLLPSSIAF